MEKKNYSKHLKDCERKKKKQTENNFEAQSWQPLFKDNLKSSLSSHMHGYTFFWQLFLVSRSSQETPFPALYFRTTSCHTCRKLMKTSTLLRTKTTRFWSFFFFCVSFMPIKLRCSCPGKGIGLDDLSRSLPIPGILWLHSTQQTDRSRAISNKTKVLSVWAQPKLLQASLFCCL